MKSIEECLDIILVKLVKNWDKPNNERDSLKSEELLAKFELSSTMQKHEFFKRLINKLVKDGYAELLETDKSWFELSHYQEDTLITIEGYYFIKDGGYVSAKVKSNFESNRLKKAENHILVLTIIVAFGALIGSVFYLVELYWKYHWFH